MNEFDLHSVHGQPDLQKPGPGDSFTGYSTTATHSFFYPSMFEMVE